MIMHRYIKIMMTPASCGNFAETKDLAIFIPDSNVVQALYALLIC